ncbi:MAG: hypothetical protein AAB263_05315 [Planctomycetota bacterium]
MGAGVALSLAMVGCGTNGADGAAGSSATASTTETGTTSSSVVAATSNSPGVVLTITAVSGQTGSAADGAYFKVGDKPVVTFTLKKSNGAAWHLNEMSNASIMMSGPTANYQRVIVPQTDLITSSVAQGDGTYIYTFATGLPTNYAQPDNNASAASVADGQLQGTALQAGTYTIGLATTWNYTVNGTTHTDTGTDTQDVIFGATGFTSGTTLARQVVKNDNCNGCHVQLQNHAGKYKDPALCVLCHTSGAKDPLGTSVEFRVMIHRIHNGVHQPSVIGVASDGTGVRTYSATPVANAYEEIDDNDNSIIHDFSDVVFPVFPSFQSAMPRHAGHSALSSANKTKQGLILQGIVACYKCHGDPDGSGPLTAPSQGDNCYNAPTRRACGSCHDDIDWANPYQNNGKTMPAQTSDADCASCHAVKAPGVANTAPIDMSAAGPVALGALITTATGADIYEPATNIAHAHPIADPRNIPEAAVVTIDTNRALNTNNGLNFDITSMSGNAASYFASGEKPTITFSITDNDGVDIPLYSLQAISTALTGPTNNRQLVFPLAGPKSVTVPVCDFSGRLVSTSTSNKGIMSRVIGSTASETLKVQFTSATAFTVTGSGETMTALGGSALPASPSTNATGTSVSAVELSAAAVVQTITVNFTTATAFTVTGSTSGVMGTGTMPAGTSASTRFTSTDGTLSFTITSGTTTFAAGNNIYMTVFQTSSNGHKFAIVAGRTSFAANDRFYYETVNNSLISYSFNLPMDLVLEFVGTTTAASGDTFTLGAIPYWGREAVYEAATSTSTTLSAAASARDRYVDVTSAAGFAASDYVLIDRVGGVGAAECVQIGVISGSRVWFKLPLRYAHAGGLTFEKVALTQRLETTNFTLTTGTRQIVTTAGMTAARSVVVSYRTQGAFGWKRHNGDSVQAVYQPPPNDSSDQGQAWGEWNGLAYESGSYTAAVWGSKPTYITRNNETQAYQLAANAATYDFAYGAASTPTAYNLISSQSNCESCHDQFTFHGGSRKGNDACVMCHGLAGMEDWPAYAGGTPAATTSTSATFRTMLHKIHMGEELANASTYTVVGNSGTGHTYGEVVFPVHPGGAAACTKCHGDDNTAWKTPAIRAHTSQTTPTLNYKTVCNSCHDSVGAGAHMDLMTTSGGVESCSTCHGPGKELGVDQVHKNR